MCGRFVRKIGATIERYLNVRPHQYKLSDRRPKGWWRDTMEANIRLLRRRAAIAAFCRSICATTPNTPLLGPSRAAPHIADAVS
jgi:hypothetical protein